VRFFRILGGGHTWPGVEIPALEPQLGQTVEDIVASVELWSFFQAHPFCAATAVPAAVERVPVRVWPNPCSDQLHVDVAGGVAAQVWVRDAYGRLVAQVDGGVIPVTGWPAGLYVAETRVNGVRTGTARFMKD
jgi:hypothetical protein